MLSRGGMQQGVPPNTGEEELPEGGLALSLS